MATSPERVRELHVHLDGKSLRAAARAGDFTGQTAGQAPGFVQGNIVVLRAADADDFLRFATLNPKITPAVGFNLYVLQSLAKKSMGYVALASLPFFGMLLRVGIVYVMPDLVTWLPNHMLGQK